MKAYFRRIRKKDKQLPETGLIADEAEEIHCKQEPLPIRVKSFLFTFVVDRSSDTYYNWLGIVSLGFIYNIILLPVRAVFDTVQIKHQTVWLCIDYFIDCINIFDIFLGSRLGYLDQGLQVTDKIALRKNYIKKLRFKMDLFAIIPLEMFSFIPGQGGFKNVWYRFNRLMKMYKVFEHNNNTEMRTNFPNLFRILSLIFFLIIIIHCNGCFYMFISKVMGLGSDTWVYPPNSNHNHTLHWNEFFTMYTYSFYWSTLTLTTIGDIPSPLNNKQIIMMTLEFLSGVLIFATIVGNVGSMITNMNAVRSDFQLKMDGVKRYMEFRGVSSELEKRVINWFDYLWTNRQSVDEQSILSALPEKLKAEIAIQVHYDTMKRVLIFKDCEPGLLVELLLKLQLQVFSPGDYICRKGDIGKEMYIVKRGKLNVVSDDGKKVFVTLNEGSVFGEISILNIAGSKSGNRRTANVRSEGYSDLFCLNKDDLWEALSEYPEAKKVLIEKGKEILMKDNLLDLEINKKAELSQETYPMIMDRMNDTIAILETRISQLSSDVISSQTELKGQISKIEKRLV